MPKEAEQRLIYDYDVFEKYVKGFKNIFLVCGEASLKYCAKEVVHIINNQGLMYSRFGDFSPNPTTVELERAIKVYLNGKYDGIFAIGGGSAIDIAKCVKLYAESVKDSLNGGRESIKWDEVISSLAKAIDVPLIAIPTTAGSGSEATRYAVIYYQDSKQSITSDAIIPDSVLFDINVLRSLPLYQKKATMMDALCHCIESYWSVNSTDESKEYAANGIQLIMKYMNSYMSGSEDSYSEMQQAAYLAGKAINISQTTAGHAMAYKITSLYGCSHGHAVALVLRKLWPWMIGNTDKYVALKGKDNLDSTLSDLAEIMGCGSASEGTERFNYIFDQLKLEVPVMKDNDLEELVNSVNPVRMRNNPIMLEEEEVRGLYKTIFEEN